MEAEKPQLSAVRPHPARVARHLPPARGKGLWNPAVPVRYPDWDRRLQNFIEACEGVPFAWGSFDCCSFAIDAIEVMTGARVLRVDWDTQVGAIRVLRELGTAGSGEIALGSALARVALDAGLDEIPRERAGRGDLVLVDSGDPRWSRAAAIVQGTHAVGPGRPAGLTTVARTRWIRAWRVPFEGQG